MAPPPIVRLLDLDGMTRFEHEAMATGFELYLPTSPFGTSLRGIAEEVFRELDRIEEFLSFYREGSDVTKINRAAQGESVRIDDVTHQCLLQGMQIAAVSDGAFDPFAGHASLVAKDRKTPLHLRDLEPPSPGENTPVIAVDPDHQVITKLSGKRWLDLGAIGKGAALDVMAQVLNDWDVSSAVLNGGGSSILVVGPSPHPDRDSWKISLPQSTDNQTMELDAPFALGASGDGFQPGHVTGSSGAQARPQSLVLAPSATLADALSTAFLLMPDAAIKEVLAQDSRFAVIATHQSSRQITSGIFEREDHSTFPEFTIVIPCWCESQRLPSFLKALAKTVSKRNLSVEIMVVDDGSPGNEPRLTAQAVEKIRREYPLLQPLQHVDHHRGKGGAILHGWENASPSSRWLAFVDADGAVPPIAVLEGLNLAANLEENLPIIAANRYHQTAGRIVERGWLRQRTGGWFATWARRQLGLEATDSQCGFKLVPANWWRQRKAPWREQGYAFDLELLLAAKSDGVPVRNLDIAWREIGGSNVGLRDGIELVQTVKRLQTKT